MTTITAIAAANCRKAALSGLAEVSSGESDDTALSTQLLTGVKWPEYLLRGIDRRCEDGLAHLRFDVE
jgi:hypothetical protein